MANRVLICAILTGQSLEAHILVMAHLTLVKLHLARPSSEYYSWRNGGTFYLDGQWQTKPATWPLQDLDPMSVFPVTIDSRLPISGTRMNGFCPKCGQRRIAAANFCGSCGHSFAMSQDSDLIGLVRDLCHAAANAAQSSRYWRASRLLRRAKNQGVGELMSQLLTVMGAFASLPDHAATTLREYIENDFSAPDMTFIDELTQVDLPLTLRKAQDVTAAVKAGSELAKDQLEVARLVLTKAPIAFGYWATFKALIKNGPIAGLEAEYGVALARLHKSVKLARHDSPPSDVQDLSVLNQISYLPTAKSVNYMRRRSRRILSQLIKHSPETYAKISEALLLAWDQALDGLAFAPAFVMRGSAAMRKGGRLVELGDWVERTDSQPSIWDQRLHRIEALFDGIEKSPDVFTWAYQVLVSCNRSPVISSRKLHLALESRYAPLFVKACELSLTSPEVLVDIDEKTWRKLMDTAPIEILRELIDKYEQLPIDGWRRYPAIGATRALISTWVKSASSEEVSMTRTDIERKLLGVSLYLSGERHGFSRQREVDLIAALMLLTIIDFSKAESGFDIFSSFDLPLLLSLMYTNEDQILAANQSIILEAAAQQPEEVDLISLVAYLVSSSTPRRELSELMWLAIKAKGGFDANRWAIEIGLTRPNANEISIERVQELFIDAVRNMGIERIFELRDLFSSAGYTVETDYASVLADFPVSRELLTTLWESVLRASDDQLLVALVSRQDLIASIGRSLTPAQILKADGQQIEILLSFLNSQDDSLSTSPELSLAATRHLNLGVQEAGINVLRHFKHLPSYWLQLAEGGLPSGLDAAGQYLKTIRTKADVTNAILACIDSQVPSVRALGIGLLQENQPILEDTDFWAQAAESDEPTVQVLVAEEALIKASIAPAGHFDRRVLTARRRNRKAKSAVQERLSTVETEVLLDTDRVTALMNLARSPRGRDREWALTRLALLSQAGVDLEGVSVSAVSHTQP